MSFLCGKSYLITFLLIWRYLSNNNYWYKVNKTLTTELRWYIKYIFSMFFEVSLSYTWYLIISLILLTNQHIFVEPLIYLILVVQRKLHWIYISLLNIITTHKDLIYWATVDRTFINKGSKQSIVATIFVLYVTWFQLHQKLFQN